MSREKHSTSTQWQERSYVPTPFNRTYTSENIIETQRNLAASYMCSISDIRYELKRISNEEDPDRDNYLMLTYYYKYVDDTGQPVERQVFSVKTYMPESLRRAAEKMGRGPPRPAPTAPAPDTETVKTCLHRARKI